MKRYELKNYDVAVIGAGPSGLCAAIAAARKGCRVVLLEKNGFLGGNAAMGLPWLGFLDLQGRQVIRGMPQEFVDRLMEKGACQGHRPCPKHNSVTCYHSETLKTLAIEMCQEAGVDVLLHLEATAAEVENGQLKAVSFYGKGNQVRVEAQIFIDCTGDGDVGYLAGAEYEMGQEETGVLQPPTVMFTIENVDTAKLFDHIEKHPDEMSYSETVEVNAGYDADYFRASDNFVFVGLAKTIARLRAEGKCPIERDNLIFIKSPNPGEIYVNSTRLLQTDATDIFSLTKAELQGQAQAAQLVDVMRAHIPGFENCFISAIQPNLGVRETRRFRCQSKVWVDAALEGVIPPDSVALSAYKIDIHSGTDRNTILKTVKTAFGIPYGCLIPQRIGGLMLAGRSVGVDAKVMASSRVMPTCMSLGEAAGYGAALAIRQGVAPGDVDPQAVRQMLLDNNAILSY